MNAAAVFVFGAVGALAPEIVRLYELRTNPSRFRWSWFYVTVSLLFAALGGVLAVGLPATTVWGAIYVGVSTPTLVNTVLKRVVAPGGVEVKSVPPMPHSQVLPPSLRSFVNAL